MLSPDQLKAAGLKIEGWTLHTIDGQSLGCLYLDHAEALRALRENPRASSVVPLWKW